jgi:dihydrofolate reductase
MIRLIAAIDRKHGLAKHGVMPWYIPEDEQYFTDQTKTHDGYVLTGATTFKETYKGRPLKERQNYILTHDTTPIEGVTLIHDLDRFLKDFEGKDLWVAGGAGVFEEVMKAGQADELYLTHIDADFRCDQFFPEYEKAFKLVEQGEPREQNGFHFTYARYAKVP